MTKHKSKCCDCDIDIIKSSSTNGTGVCKVPGGILITTDTSLNISKLATPLTLTLYGGGGGGGAGGVIETSAQTGAASGGGGGGSGQVVQFVLSAPTIFQLDIKFIRIIIGRGGEGAGGDTNKPKGDDGLNTSVIFLNSSCQPIQLNSTSFAQGGMGGGNGISTLFNLNIPGGKGGDSFTNGGGGGGSFCLVDSEPFINGGTPNGQCSRSASRQPSEAFASLSS